MNTCKFTLIMPVYNEQDGIYEFLDSIKAYFPFASILIVDDKSTDSTVKQIELFQSKFSGIKLIKLSNNLGHGGAFLHALHSALELQNEIIISSDGDGQILPTSIEKMYNEKIKNNDAIIELVRVQRLDGRFRKFISFSTRFLVLLKSSNLPKDANTPFRAFDRNLLKEFLKYVPKNSLVPNLWFSIYVRKQNKRIICLNSQAQPRIGSDKLGSSWDKNLIKRYFRLVRFSTKAGLELIFK